MWCWCFSLQTELLDPELTALEYMMREYKDIPLEKMRSVVSSKRLQSASYVHIFRIPTLGAHSCAHQLQNTVTACLLPGAASRA